MPSVLPVLVLIASLQAGAVEPDGRTATPTAILLREGNDVGAWPFK